MNHRQGSGNKMAEHLINRNGTQQLGYVWRKALAGLGLCVVAFLLALGASVTVAQDSGDGGADAEKPTATNTNAPVRDGHDRPTTYPKIKFGGKKTDDGTEPAPGDAKLKVRVYLLDISNTMAKSITVDESRETTRIEHMVAQMERSLDALAKRRDPRLRFNIVTFGSVQDFAEGEEPQAATDENAKRAKDWLAKLEAKGIDGVLVTEDLGEAVAWILDGRASQSGV